MHLITWPVLSHMTSSAPIWPHQPIKNLPLVTWLVHGHIYFCWIKLILHYLHQFYSLHLLHLLHSLHSLHYITFITLHSLHYILHYIYWICFLVSSRNFFGSFIATLSCLAKWVTDRQTDRHTERDCDLLTQTHRWWGWVKNTFCVNIILM